MDQDEIDIAGFRTFFARNRRYNLVQTRRPTENIVWTYANNRDSAEKCARMLRRLGITDFLHAQVGSLSLNHSARVDVILVTDFPSIVQRAYLATNGEDLTLGIAQTDECLAAIEREYRITTTLLQSN